MPTPGREQACTYQVLLAQRRPRPAWPRPTAGLDAWPALTTMR